MLLTASLTGCTIVSGIETYLKPPKLSEQHEQIYNALINTEGSKISLKYPKSGSYLSAFVVADIDDEPTEEAIVFYEKANYTGNDHSALRINFLDQKDGHWDSMYDFADDGSEVERVFISKLGASDMKNVIIGTGFQGEKNARIFFCNNEQKTESMSLGTYAAMDITDINNDSMNELLMINRTPEGNTAQLKWFDENGQLVSNPALTLAENTTDVLQMIYGKLSENTTAIYLDSYINTNTIITEILRPVVNEETIRLESVTADNADSAPVNGTVRNSSLISRDIDGDGIVEIPVNTVFKGYEDKPETEQINMTNWYILENNMFIRKYSGYYSITDGYAFMIPEKWEDKVTVQTANDDIIFCKYDEKPENQTPLMRICVTSSEEAQRIINEKEYADYVRISSNGDTVYLVCRPVYSGPLELSASEIQFNFKIIT
ncbi:hypothetical protein [Ruminococcus sp. HUN007]|uniref:hypothetical protein n=1 Tax=Ruminococcus sp. HUN007 TaxID=1514668 RepID=UPI0005D1E640|nr:hypothetical protein [Ruminococcus sp. HUN007]